MTDVVVCLSSPKKRNKIIFQILNLSETEEILRVVVLNINKRDLFKKITAKLQESFESQHIYIAESKNGKRYSLRDKEVVKAQKVEERFYNKVLAHAKRQFAEIGTVTV